MRISIHDLLHQYASSLKKEWKHDRSKTVGASELGGCSRRVWFDKNKAPRDPNYVDDWGARTRGDIIEEHFWVPALRATLPDGVRLLYAGKEQKSLIKGYLSATTDGLMVWPDGYSLNLDCKTLDPRANISEEKSEHHFQVQAQMGLIQDCTEHKPTESIVSYIDASIWSNIPEYVVKFNPRVYAHAHARAEKIMTARNALDLPPEGKMAGSRECGYCAWQSHCSAVTVAGVPTAKSTLDDVARGNLKDLRDAAKTAAADKDESEKAYAQAVEKIKQFLRDHNSRGAKDDGWGVSYYTTSGRQALDLAAVEAAGLDLKPFYKTDKPSESLRIK